MLCETSKLSQKMSTNRLNSLISFLKETPNDPFLKYCIALEHVKDGSLQAEDYFEDLLTNHSDYLATYYSAGKYYESLNNFDKAEALFEKGIALAKQLGDTKATGELQTALDML